MAVLADSNVLGPISFSPPTFTVEVAFNGDPFPAYSNLVVADAPTFYYRLGEASGNFTDSSGNSNTGTTHASITYGVTGALPADSNQAITTTTGFISTAVPPVAGVLTTWALEAWVKKSSAPVANGFIIGGAGTSTIKLFIDTAGKPNTSYYTGVTNLTVTGTTSICDNAWHHVVGTYDGARLLLYVDGVLNAFMAAATATLYNLAGTAVAASVNTSITTAPASNTNPLGVGGDAAGGSLVAASLDEVAFYELSYLDPWQVQNHYLAKDVKPEATWTWTDLSSKVTKIAGQRGRQYELQQVQAGTSNITFDDVARDLDPNNSASPYYPSVIPMRPVRIRAVFQGVTYNIFRGFIESWPVHWEGIDYSEVGVTATDGFISLSNTNFLGQLLKLGSADQVTTILKRAGFTDVSQIVTAGQITMIQQLGSAANGAFLQSDAQDALSLIQNIQDSENGIFYMNGLGQPVSQTHSYRGTKTSSCTFGDDNTDPNQLEYVDLQPSDDVSHVLNDWEFALNNTYSDAAGLNRVVAATDITSIREYFRRPNSKNTLMFATADALAQAQTGVLLSSQARVRFDSLVFQPLVDSNLWTQALARDISDRISVVRQGASVDCFIEQVQWQIDPPTNAIFTWSLSPAGASVQGSPFKLDSSSLDGTDVLTF